MWWATAVKRSFGSAWASVPMHSSSGDTACLPLRGAGVSLEPLIPSLPFPLCAAFPRSEYCERVRLLPACPPPFGSAFRVGRTRSRAARGGLPSSVPIRFPPCRDLRPRRGLWRSRLTERLLLPSRNLTLSALGQSSYRGSISSPLRATAWSSRCLRFVGDLAAVDARLASPWLAGPSAAGISPARIGRLRLGAPDFGSFHRLALCTLSDPTTSVDGCGDEAIPGAATEVGRVHNLSYPGYASGSSACGA